MNKENVKILTEDLNRDQLLEIISIMSSNSTKASELFLNYCKDKDTSIIFDEKIDNLWADVFYIVVEANELGGCEEWEEDQVYDNLREIQEIIKKYKTTWKARKVLVDSMEYQLRLRNSGFVDILAEVIMDLCITDEEKQYYDNLNFDD